MEEKVYPFKLTFDPEADGGPIHLLSLLKDYCVQFKKNGEIVAEGRIDEIDYSNGLVTIKPLPSLKVLSIDHDFDEVVYL